MTRCALAGAGPAICLAICAATAPAMAQTGAMPTPPGPFVPDQAGAAATPPVGEEGDTWIFSGVLQETNETFSGTLITGKASAQFELRLAGGATCDGGDLRPSLGLVRLSEIHCSDDRTMRALFVPQAHQTLKVFGHVGDSRFATVAHLLGTQPIPEPRQTAAPHAPQPAPAGPPAAPPPPSPVPKSGDPG